MANDATSARINAVDCFAALARCFCNFVEGDSLDESPLVSVAIWIAKLHGAALALRDVEPDNADGFPDIPETELAAATRNLAPFNGIYYRSCFDPNPYLSDEPTMGDVGDDLLDTYLDLKRGLILFDKGGANEAQWFWSHMHRIHWGRHAVGAMYALQCLPEECA